jgi:hypothetical protein
MRHVDMGRALRPQPDKLDLTATQANAGLSKCRALMLRLQKPFPRNSPWATRRRRYEYPRRRRLGWVRVVQPAGKAYLLCCRNARSASVHGTGCRRAGQTLLARATHNFDISVGCRGSCWRMCLRLRISFGPCLSLRPGRGLRTPVTVDTGSAAYESKKTRHHANC